MFNAEVICFMQRNVGKEWLFIKAAFTSLESKLWSSSANVKGS